MVFKKGHKINLGKKNALGSKRTSEQIVNLSNSKLGDKNPNFNKKPWNYIDGQCNKRGRKSKNHRLVSHINWCKSNQIHRIPKGCVIHHIDQNPKNDNINNLQLMTKDFHNKLHNHLLIIGK